MRLFDGPLAALRSAEKAWTKQGALRILPWSPPPAWCGPPQVVLSQETAIELGNPAVASVWLLLMTGADQVTHQRIALVGPDLGEARRPVLPFALAVLAGVSRADPYDSYRELRGAVDGVRLRGLTTRRLPSQHSVWCRVSREALDGGFGAAALGSALVAAALSVRGVQAAEVLMVTADRERVEALRPAAERAGQIVAALTRIEERMVFDCDGCELKPVCDGVAELRRMHRATSGGRGAMEGGD